MYYFSPPVTRDAYHLIREKLALLWAGLFQVVGKPGESLAMIWPVGAWAREN